MNTSTTDPNADKVRVNRLRRMAQRQRLRLAKSARRDPYAWDYGRYWLTDGAGNIVGPTDGYPDAGAVEAALRGTIGPEGIEFEDGGDAE